MRGVLKVIYNILRGLIRIALWLIVAVIIGLIKLFTLEPGKKGQITVRKARRIRALSKFKVWIFNFLPLPVVKFLGFEKYREYLNEHLRDGLQLCYNGTN